MSDSFERFHKGMRRRTKILSALAKTPLKINEISAYLDIPAPTIYRIIKDLIKDGYVTKEKSLYALTLKGRKIIFDIEGTEGPKPTAVAISPFFPTGKNDRSNSK